MKTIEERIKKLERGSRTSSVANIAIAVLCISVIIYFIFQAVSTFFVGEKEQVIKFEVMGIVNETNATTYTQIHFECIKFCQKNEQSSNVELAKCYEQCTQLGKECQGET